MALPSCLAQMTLPDRGAFQRRTQMNAKDMIESEYRETGNYWIDLKRGWTRTRSILRCVDGRGRRA